MRRRFDLQFLGGSLLLAATLALAIPVVKVVRASDAPGSHASQDSEAVCRDEPVARPSAHAAPTRWQGRAGRLQSGERFVPLNGRGYNYGAPPASLAVELRQLEGEQPR
jgi:hypothetical protein